MVEFRRAYRKRVSLLHPDRHGDGSPNIKAAKLLRSLTAQYAAAMNFERRYGRLPGTTAAARPAAAVAEVQTSYPPAATIRVVPQLSVLKLLAVLIGGGVLLWVVIAPSSVSHDDSLRIVSQPESPGDQIALKALVSPDVSGKLMLGMSSAQVREIEGDPEAVHDDLWEYGPSWISFQNGRVIDWRSSPLRSLRTLESRPQDASR